MAKVFKLDGEDKIQLYDLIRVIPMDKFRAEYGIFITTSTFTRDAIKASRAGTRVITLIDADHLLELIAKYELYVTKKVITTYELDDFFEDEN